MGVALTAEQADELSVGVVFIAEQTNELLVDWALISEHTAVHTVLLNTSPYEA